jgi:hypothetical protein
MKKHELNKETKIETKIENDELKETDLESVAGGFTPVPIPEALLPEIDLIKRLPTTKFGPSVQFRRA